MRDFSIKPMVIVEVCKQISYLEHEIPFMKTLSLLGLFSILSLTTFSQTNVGGTITDNEHWTLAGSPYTLTSTFGIPNGVTLTVDPGVEINGSFDLLVKGMILLNGSETDPITFTNTRLIFKSVDLGLSQVEFVQFGSSSGVQLADESEFNNDNPKNSNTLIVSNCAFSANAYARTKGYQTTAKLRLENCTFTDADVRGYYPMSEKIEIVNAIITTSTLVSDSYNYGIEINGSTIAGSTLSLGCCGSNFSLTDCTISESSFQDFNDSYSLSLTRVMLTNTYIDLNLGTVTISDCRFSAPSIPVSTLIKMRGGTISNSTIEGNSGLTLVETSGSTTIEKVNFKSFDVGLVVNNFTTISISENNFIGGGSFNLKNLTNQNINATNNFWGTDDEDVISQKIIDLYDNINYGIVDYTGFQTVPIITNPLPVPSAIFKGEHADGTFLTWSKPVHSDIIGYKLYRKTNEEYTFIADMGEVNSYLISEPLTTNFAVTCYSAAADGVDDQTDGSESVYSALALDFFLIAGEESACERTDSPISLSINYDFSIASNFYLISSLTEDFSEHDTVATVLASSNSLNWMLPEIETATKTFYYRLIADELQVFSETKAITVKGAPSIGFVIGQQNCSGIPVSASGITDESMEINWDLDGAMVVSGSGENFVVAWETSGERTLTLHVSEDGCTANVEEKIVFEVQDLLAVPEICEIQFDEVSGKNRISWQYENPRLMKFILYRESSQAEAYEQVAELSSDELSYVDQESSPLQQSYRYKLSAIDTCQNETSLSQAVASIHLQLSSGTVENWNLHWTESFGEGTIEVYRKFSDDWLRIAELPGEHTLFTDTEQIAGPAFYQLKFTPFSSPTCKVSSNVVFNGIMGIEPGTTHVDVYPNPAGQQASFSSSAHGSFTIVDALGIPILKGPVWQGENTIEVTRVPPGTYILKVRSDNGDLQTSRLVKSN